MAVARDLSGITPTDYSFFAPNRVAADVGAVMALTPQFPGEIVLSLDTGIRYRGLELTPGMWGNIGGGGQTSGFSGIQNVVEDLTPQLGGDLDANGFDIFMDLNAIIDFNVGDATIRHTANTLSFQTDGTTRFNINDSGFQLNGSGSRVTVILDEDDMISDSATALATQQSIKAYVDFAASGTLYNDEMAQDAVGTILLDSATIDFTYSDATPSITAVVIDDSVTNLKLANMAQGTIKGRAAGAGTGDPTDLSDAQVAAILDPFFLTPAEGTAAFQPLDADLSLIAAIPIPVTTIGRTFLSLANPGVDRVAFWDSSASTAKFGAIADYNVEGTPTAGDKVFIMRDGTDDVALVDWSLLPSGGGGGGSGTPGGLTTQIQYNLVGAFAGDADFTWVAGSGLTDRLHAAIGNTANNVSATYAPGDPVNEFDQSPSPSVLNVEENMVGDFTYPGVYQAQALNVGVGFEHTGVGGAYLIGSNLFSWINSDSTGPVNSLFGTFFTAENYGSGDILSIAGGEGLAAHRGSGDCGILYGLQFTAVQTGAGLVDEIFAMYASGFVSGGGANRYEGGHFEPPVNLSPIGNVYGVHIGDHSGLGTGDSLNIKSVGGGNLFTGHAAVGDVAEIDTVTLTVSTGQIPYKSILVANGTFSGNFSGAQLAGVLGYPILSHTGLSPVVTYAGGDFEAFIETTTTGPVGIAAGLITVGENEADGITIDQLLGIGGNAYNFGNSTIALMAGLSYNAIAFDGIIAALIGVDPYIENDGATVTTAAALRAQTIGVGGGTIVNAYGLLIGDQSGIGSSESINLKSLGAGSFNVFEGALTVGTYTEITEMVAPSAPAANKGRLFMQDNGSGKTQICVRFPTGAIQVIATEP